MQGPVYIPDAIKEVVQWVDSALYPTLTQHVYFMFGHPLEIVTRLQEMSNDPAAPKKYPLVALFTDIPVNKNTDGFYGSARLQIVIATLTEPNLTAQERLDQNFRPILQPIKEQFLKELSRHAQFSSEGEFEYTEIERYYWGRQGLYGNTGNIYNDFVDCIELQNVQVNINTKICSTIKSNFNG